MPEPTRTKSLQAASAEPTLIIETQEASQVGEASELVINGHNDHPTEGEHPSEPSAVAGSSEGGQATVAVKQENGSERIPSPNRLSISYASGNRRLVVDSDVVTSLKLFRQAGKIEVAIELSKADDGLKGILVREFYLFLPSLSYPLSRLSLCLNPRHMFLCPTSWRPLQSRMRPSQLSPS